MTGVGVDGNFERLEEEVNRLLEVLDDLRRENTALQSRIDGLEAKNGELQTIAQRLSNLEIEYGRELEGRQQVKQRVERVLSRLEEGPL